MTFFHVVVLGIVQGLTEFIPVSSTAHLLVAQKILNSHDEKIIYGALKSVEIYRAKNDVKNAKALVKTAITEQWSC